MTKKFTVPRGTADILPAEIPLWKDLEEKAQEILSLYGYKEIRTPVFEETELFARSVGETSDIVEKQMLSLASQKQSESEDLTRNKFSLRPEGTASIVRSYIENSLDKKERLSKLFYIGSMFRGERPQKGRLRQFHQIGVEAIGPESACPYLDAEVMILSVKILEAIGLKDFQLKINTLGSFDSKKHVHVLLQKRLKPELKKLCVACQSRFHRNVFRVLDCKNTECKKIVKKVGFGPDWLDEESREDFSQVKAVLNSLKIKYVEDGSLVRGLDYYTHTVFEIVSSSLGSQDALGAGGRYNNLVRQLGGPEVDAIGFALGIERILLAMPESEKKDASPLTAFIVALDEASFKKAFEILSVLRENGIAADMNYKISSVKSQMRVADKTGSRYVLLIGENERAKGVVTLKDMRQGTQAEVPFKDNCAGLTTLLKEGM